MCENNENGNDISNRINAVRDFIIEYLGKGNAGVNSEDDSIKKLRYINKFLEFNNSIIIRDIEIIDNNLEFYNKVHDVYYEFSAKNMSGDVHVLDVVGGRVMLVKRCIIDDIETLERLVLIIKGR